MNKHKLGYLLIVLLFVIGCSNPLARPPKADYVVDVPTAEPRFATRGIGTGTGCNLGVEGGPWDSEHQFPRIITTDGDYTPSESETGNLNHIARYDAVMWTLDWPTYANYSPAPAVTTPFAYVRALNSGTKFLGFWHSYIPSTSYCHISATFPHRCNLVTAATTADGSTAPGDGWLAKNAAGVVLAPGLGLTEIYMNWSNLDPDHLTNNWGKFVGDYIVNEVNDDLCSGVPCWDGYYFESMNIPHARWPFPQIDANENGTTDLVEGVWNKCAVDAHQMDGYNVMFDILATGGITVAGGEGIEPGLSGSSSNPRLQGHATAGFNGNFPSDQYADCSSGPNDYSGGYTVPGGNLWHYNMRQALKWEDSGDLVVNMMGPDMWGGGDSYYTNYVADENQQKRLVVGSTLLMNGYSIPHNDQIPYWYPCDECLVNGSGNSTIAIADGGWLGCPLGPALNTTDSNNMREVLAAAGLLSGRIWWRAFDNGIVVVNASETDGVTIDLGDTGDWRKILANAAYGGDTTHNDGGEVTNGILTVDAYDAYVLVRVDADTGTAVPTRTPTVSPTACPGCTPTAIPTSGATTPTAEPLACPGLPSSGTAILRDAAGNVVETVVYSSSGNNSYCAQNWQTPPPSGRVWATGTPNPGTQATPVP